VCDASARMAYASPWRRMFGWLVDGLIAVLTLLLGASTGLDVLALAVVALWLYFALLESSSRQGTLAKMLVNERVTDLDGRRISFKRATARHFAMYLSAVSPFLVGFLMAFWTKRRQALHDYIASTLVTDSQTRSAGP
jgi:uncharacterized RDD family membrane protein YckC